ncbi:hypothetical protein KC324_g2278 [Hortaea werneckii]|nr:hypothetical protein KC324_g2278 [Hortaea werneckii]
MDLQAEHQPDILAGELGGGTTAEPYFCCEEDFGFEELFYQHWRSKHRPMCPISNCKYSRKGLTKDTKHNFLRHWATHFTALKAQTCSCTKCGRTFDNKSNMSRHQRNCAGLRTCDDHQSSGAHQAHVTPIFENVLSETNVDEQQNEQYQLSPNALLNAAGGLDNAQYPFDPSNDFAGLNDTPWSLALSPRDPSSRRPELNMSGQDTAFHLTTTGMQASSYDMTDFFISEMFPEVQPTITNLTPETGISSQEEPSLQQNIREQSTQPAADVWMQQPWTVNTPIGGHSNARSETPARGHKRRSSGSSFNSRKQIRSTESVVDILGKMQKYAFMIRSQKRDKDAKKALDRIRSILEAVRQPGPAYSQATHTEDQWNDLSTHLDSSNIVDVNRQRLIWSPNCVSKVNRHREVLIYKDQWKITLTTHTHVIEENGRKATRSLSVLRVDPFTSPDNCSSFAVFLGREIDSSSTIRMHPAIFAYRHVPSDSVVFKLVEQDDIEGLRQLLAVQEATIRDVDEVGGSLLSYASYFASPLCCKFLIDSGADVDREERIVGVTSYPLRLADDDPGAPIERVARSRECREYLFEAGADPTLETDYGSSALYDAISIGGTMDPKESVS